MSMGDMLMVKGEEGDTITGHKAQVILHLQSISQGANDDIADTPTTVLAVETHQEDSSTEGDEVEYGYPITCGDSRAVLLYKKFVCPGINVKCVKFNDQLISPKQFVQLAGKSTLKDWKRAIRLGGVMLRKMMDSGQIDFYQHDTVCTNSCRSTKFDLLINNTRLPSAAHLPTPTSPLPGGGQILHMEEKSEDSGSVMMEARTSHMIPVQSEANGEIKKEIEDPDESLSFWQGLSELGLVGEVVSSIRTELLALLRGVEQRGEQALLHHTDAAVLSTLTQMFGLLDSVRQVLDMQRSRTADSEELLHNRLDVLECQLDNQKRQPLDWRTHPSSPFPIIVHTPLEATPFGRPPFGKRPRLQRSASTSSASASSAAASSGSPFTVLSPVTFSPLGQTHSVPGLPISSLAQLPTGSQLFPLHSASAVTGAYRGGKAEVLGISPASGLSLPGAASLRHPGALSAMEIRPPSRGEMLEKAVDVVERRREPEREREEEEEEEEEEERGRRRAVEDEEEEEEEAMAVDGAESMVGERRQEEKQRREEGGQRTHKTSGGASKKKTHKRAFH